ncbi:DoxX family protein [Streptomyces sp. NPDC026672]|uniref:DoxX family protein n=1 Tax=unclassified Streptomyces TaxID=2593676 RepID=UPI003401B675
MFLATVIVVAVLVVILLFSGAGKVVRQEQQLKTMAKVGFPEDKLWLLAIAEFAGAVGLVVGLFWWPLGLAAAIGVILYFVGAAVSHIRVSDKEYVPALVLMLAAVAAFVLRLLSR